MPSALVTTAGATTANAYCSRAEATAYIDNLPLAAVRLVWTAASDDDKDRALLYATTLIDRAFTFIGSRVSTTQALEWPRYVYGYFYGVGGGNSYDLGYGYPVGVAPFYIDPTTIPDRLKQATAEYARQLLESDRTADASTAAASGIKRLKADTVEIEYQSGAVVTAAKPVPDAVTLLLAGIGFLAGAERIVPLVRV